MKLVKHMIPLIPVVGLVAWILVAELVFITQEKPTPRTKSLISKADDIHNDHEAEAEEEGHYELFIQIEEDEEEKEAFLRFDRSVVELFAKDIFGTETFDEEFSKINRLIVEETAKIEDKRFKKLWLEKDIHIPDISVEDKQLLRFGQR